MATDPARRQTVSAGTRSVRYAREGEQVTDPTLREFLEERIRELTRRLDALTVSIDALNRSSEQFLTRSAFEVAHETLRTEQNMTRVAVGELRTTHVQDVAELRGNVSTLWARFAGAAAALSLGIAVLIALLTILEIGK